MRLTVFRALVLLSAATTACQGLPSEEVPLIVPRRVVSIELDTMTIDRIPFSVGGLLPAEGHGFVRAILWMANDEAPLRRGERVRVEFLASDGEYEVMEGPPDLFGIEMASGHSLEEIKPRLPDIRSRLALVWTRQDPACPGCLNMAALWVSPGTSRAWAMQQVKRWPNVREVWESNQSFGIGDPSAYGRGLYVYMPATRTGPPRTDRVLLVTPGQELQVRYTQPDGSRLIRSWAIR